MLGRTRDRDPYCRGYPQFDRDQENMRTIMYAVVLCCGVIVIVFGHFTKPEQRGGQIKSADYTALLKFFENNTDIVDNLLATIDTNIVNQLTNTLNDTFPVDTCTSDNKIIDEMIQYVNDNNTLKNDILKNKVLINQVKNIIDGNSELKNILDKIMNTSGGKKSKRIKYKGKRSKKRGGKKSRRKTNKNNK